MNPPITVADATWESVLELGQWKVQEQTRAEGTVTDYRIVNLNDGLREFYEIFSGPYGQPRMCKEPDLALDVPDQLAYARPYVRPDGSDAVPDQKIAGIIIKSQGKVLDRYSLTNAKRKGIKLDLSRDGVLTVVTVDGATEYFLYALFLADKNRVQNYDAFFSPQRHAGPVTVYELEDLF